MSNLNLPLFQAAGLVVINPHEVGDEITMQDPFMEFTFHGNNLKTGKLTFTCNFWETHAKISKTFEVDNNTLLDDIIVNDLTTGDTTITASNPIFVTHPVIKLFSEVV